MSISADDLIKAFQDKLSEAHYEIAVLRAQIAVQERAALKPASAYDTHPELATTKGDPTPPS